MRLLAMVLIVLIIIAYVRDNQSYNSYYEILQTTPSGLTWELLREKNPIVVTANKSLDEAFRYLYISKRTRILSAGDDVVVNNARFCVVRPNAGVGVVEMINPKYKNDENYQSVEILLNKDKSLVLPQHWMFKVGATQLTMESYLTTWQMIIGGE